MSTTTAAFIGHGSPMNALESNRYTRVWQALGDTTPRPRAILAISAHWYVGLTAVTAMSHPRTIHDFFGFPRQLHEFLYPAPGAPDVAEEVAEVVQPVWCGLDRDAWGLDHGTWSVLAHMYPNADIPVVQLSLNATRPLEHHVQLGAKLAPLRQTGVMIVCSGNVVHNLRLIDFSRPDAGDDWAARFDRAAQDQLLSAPHDIARLQEHPDYPRAVPTPDHFLPLLYLAGLASAAGTIPDMLVDGYFGGSLSMTCFGLDASCPDAEVGPGAAGIPDKGEVPPAESNI